MTKSNLKPIFVTGTGTDVGKTYVTAMLCKFASDYLKGQKGEVCPWQETPSFVRLVGYYKAAISGANSIAQSDAGYVNSFASLGQKDEDLTSYLYEEAVSPHLAQKHAGGEPISFDKIMQSFYKVYDTSKLTVLEGSGGVYCPLRWDDELYTYAAACCADSAMAQESSAALDALKASKYFNKLNLQRFTILDLMRIVKEEVGVKVVIVADAALGVINNTLTTVTSLTQAGFDTKDMYIILNNFIASNPMYEDNKKMVETMTSVKVIATVAKGDSELKLDSSSCQALFEH